MTRPPWRRCICTMARPSPPDSVVIRPMQPEDVDRVALIDRLSFPTPWPRRSYLFELRRNPHARLWVAEKPAAGVVGMLVMWLLLTEAHIATLAVHPDHRRQGIGARLLAQALRLAQQEGARSAYLEVRVSNRAAQALYRRFGFRVTGRRPHYYQDTGEDALLMTLEPLDPLALASLPDEEV